MTLADLKPGDKAIVKGWSSSVPPLRLMEHGILPGTVVEIVRFAPLGDPVDIKVRGFHLSIRKEDAAQIILETEFPA
ncbi:MAG: FeoA family protein [Bacteroidetes bacterium]|nr:FeoA family protein [Bacteroidota bacterium]